MLRLSGRFVLIALKSQTEAGMDNLKQKVKELRRKKGWAQEDLAREIGVSLSTVQRWEKQGAKPSRLARRELKRLFQEGGIDSLENGR